MKDYYKWCLELLNNWKQKNVENIVNLFDENVEYYETPAEKINTIKEIRKMWKEKNKTQVVLNLIYYVKMMNVVLLILF